MVSSFIVVSVRVLTATVDGSPVVTGDVIWRDSVAGFAEKRPIQFKTSNILDKSLEFDTVCSCINTFMYFI